MRTDVDIIAGITGAAASCTTSGVDVSLLRTVPRPKVDAGPHRGPFRVATAVITASLVLGVLAQPLSWVDVDIAVAAPITPEELDGLYNFIELNGRYVMTSDGRIFEVQP